LTAVARRSWLPYLVCGPLLVAALVVGARGGDGPVTAQGRVDRIAKQVRCPTCESQSVADSRAPASDAIRDEVRRRVDAGQSDGEITSFLVSRYGRDILLKPEARGVAGLVWALPVVVAAVALVGLVFAFRRWRARPSPRASAEDEALVAAARTSGE
jgi:cytochrome c-type biogenesis protein CcmH